MKKVKEDSDYIMRLCLAAITAYLDMMQMKKKKKKLLQAPLVTYICTSLTN